MHFAPRDPSMPFLSSDTEQSELRFGANLVYVVELLIEVIALV